MKSLELTYLMVFLGLALANVLIAYARHDFAILDRCWWQGVALLSHYVTVSLSRGS